MYRRQAQPAKVTPFQFLDGLKLLIHRFKQQLDLSGMFLDHLSHRTIVSLHDLGASKIHEFTIRDAQCATAFNNAEMAQGNRVSRHECRMPEKGLYSGERCRPVPNGPSDSKRTIRPGLCAERQEAYPTTPYHRSTWQCRKADAGQSICAVHSTPSIGGWIFEP
jgi:hypothetical protein